MKSNVCRIENGTRDLTAILVESERVAEYNGLTHKQALQLRLLCEEIDGMLPHIIDDFDGELWIEFENGVCKVNVSIEFKEFTSKKKEELVSIAKNKKNAAAVGIVGKIRSAVENYFMDADNLQTYPMALESYQMGMEYCSSADYYSYIWGLKQYRSTVKKEEKTEAWDELEKSVIASVADDVIVGVKGRKADIIIVKKFA
jgi:hypothetical protein